MRKLTTLLVVLLATSAKAEWSPSVKSAVETQFRALHDGRNAMHKIGNDYIDLYPADAALSRQFVEQTAAQYKKHFKALLLLLGAPPNPDRAAQLADAAAAFASVNYGSALATLDSMAASSHVTQSRNLINSAQSSVSGFDSTLDYTEPRLDSNLAFPDPRSWVAPHGDYEHFHEMFYSTAEFWISAWAEWAGTLTTGNPRDAGFVFTKMNDLTAKSLHAMALSVGIEPSAYVNDIDIQEQNDTTNRGRHFFRAVMAIEILINTDHLGAKDNEGDIFGRTQQVRGLPYAFNRACRDITESIRDTGDTLTAARAETLRKLCEWWARTDNAAANIFHLRYNTTFVGQPEGGITCGAGTFLSGNECLPDPCPECPPTTCPTYVPQWAIGSAPDTAIAQCVEVP